MFHFGLPSASPQFDLFEQATSTTKGELDEEFASLFNRKRALSLIIKEVEGTQGGSIDNSVARLNVGGKKLDISRESTLTATAWSQHPSLLSILLSGRWDPFLLKDRDGRVYLDFEPEWLEPLFNYMRAAQRASTADLTGQYPVFPKARQTNDQAGFETVINKFRMEKTFTQATSLGSLSGVSGIPCLNDPYCRDAVVGFVKVV
jgi:hypothetical protein